MKNTISGNLKMVFTDKKFYLAGLLVIFAAWFNFFISNLIQLWFPYRLPADDLIFDILPYVGWTQYLTDIAVVLSALVLLIYIIKHDLKNIPFYLAVLGCAYLLRAFIIPLTPLGSTFGNMATYGLTTIQQHGMFPSGHTALAAVSYLVVDRKVNYNSKIVLFILLLVQIASLLLSRGHYSIDIVGGVLISYFAYNELVKYKAAFCCGKTK